MSFDANRLGRVLLAFATFMSITKLALGAGAIRCGKLFEVETGELRADQVIVFDNSGKITAAGPTATTSVPPGLETVDLSLATCLPGLIDAHTHLNDDPGSASYRGLGISAPRAAIIGAKNARLTLLAGFTTVRNMTSPGYSDVALRDGINAGDVPGPRMVVSGPALSITGGHNDQNLLAPEFHYSSDGVADGVEGVRAKVRENVKYGADVIKVMATGGVMSEGDSPGAEQYSPAELRAIVETAHSLGRKVGAHAHGTLGIKDATVAGVDSIEHASYIDEEGIRLMKEHGTYLVPTLYLGDWLRESYSTLDLTQNMVEKLQAVLPAARANLRRAFREQVRVAFGTDAGVYPHGLNAHEFSVMVDMGMTPLAAIRSATLNAADLLGWADRVGSLKPGHYADLIAVTGDPLADIRVLESVKFVMKGGAIAKNEFTSGVAPAALGAVRCGRLLDVETGQVSADRIILFDSTGTITAIGAAESTTVPAGIKPLHLPAAVCLPGLIDVHTHLNSDPGDTGYAGLGISTPRAALIGAKNARLELRAGFTTVRNLGASGYTDIALRDGIEAGDVIGPRMLASGPPLSITGGHADINLLPFEYHRSDDGVADGPWAARAKVREVVKYGADVIKVMASGGVFSKGDQPGASQYSLEELQAITAEAHKLGRRVAAHAHGTQSIKDAIRAGVDSVEHASLIDDEGITLAKRSGTYLVFDIYNDDFILEQGIKTGSLPESIEKEKQLGRVQRENFRRTYRAGVKIAYGTDAGVYPHGDNAKQFAKMVEWGMKPLEAIQSATVKAADLIGWSDKVGTLKPGRYADLIAVEGNPTQDVRVLEAVKFVLKGGRVIRNDFATP
jgi:imidazolonepropionase-like amidohydrolase